jgi:signal peptidase
MVKKILNWTSIGLLFLSLAMVIYTSFLFVQSNRNGTLPKLFGYYFMFVETGSMEPILPVGSIIIVKEVTVEKAEIDEIISFYSLINVGGKPVKVVITHRVVDIINENEIKLITKGDANESADTEPVTSDNFIGVTVVTITFLTFLSRLFGNYSLILFIVVFIVLILVITEGFNLIRLYVRYQMEKKEHKELK